MADITIEQMAQLQQQSQQQRPIDAQRFDAIAELQMRENQFTQLANQLGQQATAKQPPRDIGAVLTDVIAKGLPVALAGLTGNGMLLGQTAKAAGESFAKDDVQRKEDAKLERQNKALQAEQARDDAAGAREQRQKLEAEGRKQEFQRELVDLKAQKGVGSTNVNIQMGQGAPLPQGFVEAIRPVNPQLAATLDQLPPEQLTEGTLKAIQPFVKKDAEANKRLAGAEMQADFTSLLEQSYNEISQIDDSSVSRGLRSLKPQAMSGKADAKIKSYNTLRDTAAANIVRELSGATARQEEFDRVVKAFPSASASKEFASVAFGNLRKVEKLIEKNRRAAAGLEKPLTRDERKELLGTAAELGITNFEQFDKDYRSSLDGSAGMSIRERLQQRMKGRRDGR